MQKLQGHKGKVRALAFSPSGRMLASVAGREQRVSLWTLPGGKQTLSPGDADEVQAFAFNPGGTAIAVASGRYLRHWDLATNTITERWLRAANYCRHVAFSPDGSLVAASCFNKYGAADRCRVDLFPLPPPSEKTFLVGDYGTPSCLAFSPDGRFLGIGGDFQLVRIWNMKEKVRGVAWKLGLKVHALAFSPDGAVCAVAAGKELQLHDTATNKPRGTLVGHKGPARAVCFSPDGTLLSTGDDGTARLWDVGTGRERAVFDWKVGPLTVAAFSPDGTLAAVGGEEGLVVWDVE